MASTINSSLPPLTPPFLPHPQTSQEPPKLAALISHLALQTHIEGGYFVETDRAPTRVPNPFPLSLAGKKSSATADSDILVSSRNASTTIHYLLTPANPLGHFHRNRGRTVHTLHRGRGRYVIIHADEAASDAFPGGYGGDDGDSERGRWRRKARVETFVVGPDVLNGERVQWIVEGGKYKSSFLLEDEEGGGNSGGLLISETVVPGFEYSDHDFMREGRMEALVEPEQAREMGWMLRRV